MPEHDLTTLYAFHVHVFFSVMFFFGVFTLYHWVTKTEMRSNLERSAGLWTIVIGSIGVLMTVPFCLLGWRIMVGG
jgi:hypothetical protein